jgi:hypothetical protein
MIKGFGTFASKAENGFVALRNCFMTVSRPALAATRQKKILQRFHDVTRLKHPCLILRSRESFELPDMADADLDRDRRLASAG